jgi:hypothetical protein
MPGFLDYVQQAWNKQVPQNQNPFGVLHIKLSRAAKAFKNWSKSLIPQGTLALAIYKEVIKQLENAQEFRQLSLTEQSLMKQLKERILGLLAIQRCQARQQSWPTWLRLGDANTKYFQLMANQRKKKNHIHSIEHEGGVALTQATKQQVVVDHFHKHLGTNILRSYRLKFEELGWATRPLQHLEVVVEEDELHSIIKQAPKDKTPGPDSFIGAFF